MKFCAVVFMAMICTWGNTAADNLFYVSVHSRDDALVLRSIGVEPVLRTANGYLVLTDASTAAKFSERGIQYELIAESVTRAQLVIPDQIDYDNPLDLPLLFQEDNLRLYSTDAVEQDLNLSEYNLMPIRNELMPIKYLVHETEIKGDLPDMADLEELISHVDQDSLLSYVQFMERHGERFFAWYKCSASSEYNVCDESRDTLVDMLQSFGYASAACDTFIAVYETWSFEAFNVLATKQGTIYPDQQIVIGAHRDCSFVAPGADDNGSGVAALLEMARILKDYDTNVTIVFALFDAEEHNKQGSNYYVYNAAVRGDNIICMINMDMIGHFENSTDAKLFHGPDTTYCTLWRSLAQPLVGLDGHLWGQATNSDHLPFQQFGYPVLYLNEYIQSSVYHTELDSSKYMSFDYLKKMAQATLATAYSISQSFEPDRSLLFEYTAGLPAVVSPFEPTPFEVAVSGTYVGIPVPNTGQLHYRINNGDYEVVPLTELSPNHYQGSLPAVDCSDQLEFYVSAQENQGEWYTDGAPDIPHRTITATEIDVSFADNFETDLGWQVTGNAAEGHWERGVPAGDGSRGDPVADYDGSGNCYLTGNAPGDSDLELGGSELISPTFDAVGDNPLIHYSRWLSNDCGPRKHMVPMEVLLSNDGGQSWTLAEMIGPEKESSGSWYESNLLTTDIIEPTDDMKVRFEIYSDAEDLEIVEAGLDDFSVAFHVCYICGDANSDNNVNIGDAVYLLTHIFQEGPPPAQYKAGDTNCDGAVNIGDAVYLLNFVFKAGAPDPCFSCPQW